MSLAQLTADARICELADEMDAVISLSEPAIDFGVAMHADDQFADIKVAVVLLKLARLSAATSLPGYPVELLRASRRLADALSAYVSAIRSFD